MYRCFVLLLTLVVVSAGPAQAQMAEPTNLQVLDKSMNGQEVMQVMRSFALGLGVRCNFCHMGEDGQPLSSFDFASDEKEHKKIAREMMKMTRAINETHIAPLGLSDPYKVECVTCHRGQKEPTTIEHELESAYAEGGIDAALERYASLREEFMGAPGFDFRERPFMMFAGGLVQEGKQEEGLKALQAATEYFPDSAEPHLLLGMTYLRNGDKEKAKVHAEAAKAIDPENRRLQRLLKGLEE